MHKKLNGFTLIEVLIVLLLFGILIGIGASVLKYGNRNLRIILNSFENSNPKLDLYLDLKKNISNSNTLIISKTTLKLSQYQQKEIIYEIKKDTVCKSIQFCKTCFYVSINNFSWRNNKVVLNFQENKFFLYLPQHMVTYEK